MTEKEAKNMLEERLKCLELDSDIEGCDGDCNECEYNYTQGTIGEQKESLKMAIEALEKQIPKKVLETDDKDLSDIWYRCPACKGDMTHIRGFYCPYCGKRLNWGEEEGGLNDI